MAISGGRFPDNASNFRRSRACSPLSVKNAGSFQYIATKAVNTMPRAARTNPATNVALASVVLTIIPRAVSANARQVPRKTSVVVFDLLRILPHGNALSKFKAHSILSYHTNSFVQERCDKRLQFSQARFTTQAVPHARASVRRGISC